LQPGRAQGPTVVVENRPGGGTVIGTEAVERAEPDGHTVLLVANSFVANPPLKRASYDPTGSFEPVCYLAATPMVLVVLASSPYRTLNDLIAAARAKPGELAFASGGPGSSLHVAIEVLKRAANINVTYVPYGGTAPAINALMGNHVAAVWADYPTVVSQLSSGALRGLVTISRTRVEALPEVPTLTETGISNYEADIFYGIVAPAKTPPEMVNRLSAWLIGALKASDMKPKLAQQGLFPVGICGAEFGAYLQRMVDDYTRIIREANITVK
jgi:tripartite-type tricarboxylate transporter receptor subunit TctC